MNRCNLGAEFHAQSGLYLGQTNNQESRQVGLPMHQRHMRSKNQEKKQEPEKPQGTWLQTQKLGKQIGKPQGYICES